MALSRDSELTDFFQVQTDRLVPEDLAVHPLNRDSCFFRPVCAVSPAVFRTFRGDNYAL